MRGVAGILVQELMKDSPSRLQDGSDIALGLGVALLHLAARPPPRLNRPAAAVRLMPRAARHEA